MGDDVRRLLDSVPISSAATQAARRAYLRGLAAEAIRYLTGVTRTGDSHDDSMHMAALFGVVEQIIEEATTETDRGHLG